MRIVRIACILQSKCSLGRPNPAMHDSAACIEEAVDLLDEAGAKHADIAVLSEFFPDWSSLNYQPADCPAVNAVRRAAARHSMNAIAPVCELGEDGRRYNTAFVIDRRGEIVGRYRKNFPYWSEAGVTPGVDRPVFDLDFGRIGVAICFESNWPDIWMDLGAQGAEIVFWPSGYSAGRKLTAAAIYNNYYVVSCTGSAPDTTLVDITGEVLCYARGPGQVVIHEIDLDRTMVHDNFNHDKLIQLKSEMGERVNVQYFPKEAWWLVESVDPELSVKKLLAEREIETLPEFTRRSRREILELRAKGLPIPEQGPTKGTCR